LITQSLITQTKHLLAACRLDVSGRSAVAKRPEVALSIMEALQRNFVFKGIPDNLLLEVHGWSSSSSHCRGCSP
jgi:hypothetical protein